MVTIEQKLTLFSKLLNQDIKEDANKKFRQLDKDYEKRLAENKFQVDKEATEIIEQTRKRAELKKVELISKGKMSSKKELMQIKEALISRFMKNLKHKVVQFTHETGYRKYLEKLLGELEGLRDYKNDLIIYLTEADFKQNKDFIEEKLMTLGIKRNQLSFQISDEDILGGFVIKDPSLNMRIDESIQTVMDEAKDKIVEKISIVIEEAGDERDES